ncbi:hypothetical protein JCM5353_003864 [Sporobolomyces roseus]
MANFNSLPLEVKRMIARQAHYSDFNYRKRVGKPNTASREQLKGQALATLSLVNKEMRKICLNGLFSRVKSSRVRDEIFEYHILENQANFITTFEFEGKMSLETTSYIVLHILPRLPNLVQIIINDRRFFTPFLETQPSAPEWTRSTFVWRKFLEFAKQIDMWRFNFSNEHQPQIESLLQAGSQSIETLALRPDPDHPALCNDDSPIPPLLELCPNLRQLHLCICHPHPALLPSHPLIHASALSSSYTFQKTLTVLAIYCVPKGVPIPIPIDPTILSFASLFPELLDFHICGAHVEFDPENAQTFPFPRLLRFEIGCWSFTETTTLLKRLELPRIRYLDCHLQDRQSLPDFLALAHQFATYSNTLHSIRLHAKYGLYSSSFTSFLEVLSPHSFEIHTTWDQGEPESLVELNGGESELEVPFREMVLDGLTAGSKELIEWANERIEETGQTKDLSGAGLMYKALNNVKELRKWLKE